MIRNRPPGRPRRCRWRQARRPGGCGVCCAWGASRLGERTGHSSVRTVAAACSIRRPTGIPLRASPLSRAHDLCRHPICTATPRKGRIREMSNTVELTKENFDDIVPGPEGKDFVFIDFWAGWCGPCRQFAPVYEKAAERHPDLVFAKVDTEAQQELASAFGIQSIPTLAIIREGVLVFSQAGALPEPVFEDLIGQARNLDMTEVKRKVAEEQAAEGQA
ncbi:thioredoxin domain-containing protein [Kitasatospora aureofaciens]|uniref:thioredoxin family protein n=1 Tax=Kitasatospora aureofaciens TaxID=1894 RepID=UPI00242E8C35|nr:thioredoxin domain-containing protein [Kitasatospora aureofaciens]